MIRTCGSCNKEIDMWNSKSVFLIDGEQSFICDNCLKAYRLFYKKYNFNRDNLDYKEKNNDYFNVDSMLPSNCKLINRRFTYFISKEEFEEFKRSINK